MFKLTLVIGLRKGVAVAIFLTSFVEIQSTISYGRAIEMRFMGQDGGITGALLLRYVIGKPSDISIRKLYNFCHSNLNLKSYHVK